MSRTLYWYDDGDDDSSDSWGESPQAYLRRKWLESHRFLVPVSIDYEAAHEHAQEFIANLSVDDIHAIVDAALGRQDE